MLASLTPFRSAAAGALVVLFGAVAALPAQSSGSERYLRAHVEFLAGDALAGRRSGSRDEWIAAEYAASQLRQWGIEPAGAAAGLVVPVMPSQADEAARSGADGPGAFRPVTWNAVGVLPGRHGRRAGEFVLVSAHIDHLGTRDVDGDGIFNGADDNASGAAAVLEVARRLSAARPDRSVLFVLFGGEERGGLGSRAFAEAPPVPLERIVAALNVEMIGRADPTLPAGTVWLTGFERSTLGAALAARRLPFVADPRPHEQFFFRSDNLHLARRGVVAHTVSTFGLHADYHTPDDELDRIDFAHMEQVVDILTEAVGWLARSAFVPAWNEGGRPQP